MKWLCHLRTYTLKINALFSILHYLNKGPLVAVVTKFQSSQKLQISVSVLVSPLLYVVGTDGAVVGRAHEVLCTLEAQECWGKVQVGGDPGCSGVGGWENCLFCV